MAMKWGEKKSHTSTGNGVDSHLAFTHAAVMPASTAEMGELMEAQANADVPSVINQTSTFKGTISGESDFVILGECNGEITLLRNTLTARPTARIEANVLAEKIQIEGTIKGDLCAREVKVSRTGCVIGNILAPRVSIEDGAKIKGSIDMDEQMAQEKFDACNNQPVTSSKSAALVDAFHPTHPSKSTSLKTMKDLSGDQKK